MLDEQVWSLSSAVGDHEHHAVSTTRTKAKFAEEYFQNLHWVAKNAIHLRESADAVLKTCQQVLAFANTTQALGGDGSIPQTANSPTYLATLFDSTSLRTSSLQARVQNTIALSLNLVAQTDSQCLMAESSSMNIMALATLIFLAMSTVATIFGSQFFQFTFSGRKPAQSDFMLSKEFRLFWAVAAPLTVISMGTC